MKAKTLLPLVLIAGLGFVTVKLTVEALKRAEAASVKSRPVAVDRSLRQAGGPALADTPDLSGLRFAGSPGGDFDGNGYVDLADFEVLAICLTVSGPEADLSVPACLIPFDFDDDDDVDLADFAAFTGSLGHLPIPLRDTLGDVLAVDSTVPYSGRQTCDGSCHAHDLDVITNGLHFQQGRTDTAGNIAMGDDAFGDGRWWNYSRGRNGRWVVGLDLTSKDNSDPLQIGITSFAWIRDCGGCHVGGGPGEFDRDGFPYFDVATGKFGFEALGRTWDDVRLDGDYSVLDMATGEVVAARWDQTGLSSPDCLFCHRAERTMQGAISLNLTWRQATLAAGVSLVDAVGQPVRAFEAAGTAAQGWYSTLDIQGSTATVLQIDYSVGAADGSLLVDTEGSVSLAPSSFSEKPTDQVCAPCHKQTMRQTGNWFDESDLHFAKLNNRRDTNPANDIPDDKSTACNYCHPGNLEHNFAKGNFLTHNWRDDLDWVDFRSCRECHLTEFPDGTPNPQKHPDSPPIPGTLLIHNIGFVAGERGPMRIMSCEACHILYGTVGHALADSSISAYFSTLPRSLFYSADPLDPTNPDKSRWYPNLVFKTDSDGEERLFPTAPLDSVYWADWDQNGTPQDLSDDTIAPVVASQIRILNGGVALPGVTDDNADGRLEINRPEEILTYIQYLKGGNPQGRVLATRPVLVKGKSVWYQDALAPGGVGSFDFEGQGIAMEPRAPFVQSVDHGVFPKEESWGANDDCNSCHRSDGLSPVFDRLILVDPWGPDGQPVYETVRTLTDTDPDTYHDHIVLKDSQGTPLTAASTAPYSGRQTCGGVGCHDTSRVAHGSWFEDGRTDVNGNLDMRDDYNDDGRFWIKSAGRYGKWGQSFQYLLAAKNNTHASQIDQPTFNWVRDCSGCHPGAGPGEFDRDGELLYDQATGQFGYEVLGKTPGEVALDGDYVTQNYATGSVSPAPWDVTGLSGPDCLLCHRNDREIGGSDQVMARRRSILATGANLVDANGDPVPAFAAAGTAGQGWYSQMNLGTRAQRAVVAGSGSPADQAFIDSMMVPGWDYPAATDRANPVLQIDYNVGLADGSLNEDPLSGSLLLSADSVSYPPKDQGCWSCHPFATITGTTWFDDRDIHYRKFNNLNDADPNNDIAPSESRVCTVCHPGTADHNIGKGNSPQLQYRNELDWGNGFRTCRNCHLTELADGSPNPLKHPDAPDVPGSTLVHIVDPTMFEILSCQACHIRHALVGSVLFRDITMPGSVGTTQRYYSTDPLNPQAVDDDSRWYPALELKEDVDGHMRWFPANIWITIYFGDWDRNGTPGDLTDDVIAPLPTWRVAQVVGSTPLPVVTDDDGDGRLEINREEEVLAYLDVLKGPDANGVPVAANPVLVRGQRVFYEDPAQPGTMGSFEHVGAGLAMDAWYPYIWGMDHNVLPVEQSWGYAANPSDGCRDCHRPLTFDSPVFDRLILIDPLDENNQTVYRKVRAMTGLNPP